MDFLFELIFTMILESFFGLTIKNPQIKKWAKTVIFLTISELFALFVGWMSYTVYCGGNTGGGIVCGILAVIFAIGFLVGGICGHKKQWESE